MTTTPHSTVVGVFHEIDDARDAVEALKDVGFDANDIGLLAHDRERGREVAEETGARSHAGEGAATGLVAGGILGGIGGWLVGIGALAIPGVGPFIAAGAIGAALTGAAVGAGVGAIAGALIGMGLPEEEAKYYEGEVRGGRTLVTVRTDSRYDEARRVLREHGAYDIEDRDSERSMTRVPATATAGVTTGNWTDYAPEYRNRWQQRSASSGGRWEDYEPAYRYGYEMRSRPEYRTRNWDDAESDLRRDWETRYPNSPWDRMRENVRESWDNTPGHRASGSARDGDRLQLREEELHVEKRPVETGQVTLSKDVVEQQRTIDVPVTREEVTIERRPVERRPSDSPIEEGRTIEVPVREERVEVDKEPVVYEEVAVGKREVGETQTISDTVRREEARLERHGDVNVSGWNEAMPSYRERWQARHGTTGGNWADYEPHYRYGYEMRAQPAYRGRSFADAEPSMRTDWERRYPNTPWTQARENVQEAWDA
jgi:uncharacterized protein (TIGR02271 family)